MEQVDKRDITIFKKAFKDMIASSNAAYVKSDAREVRRRNHRYSKDEIIRIVECGDAVQRAELSEFFFSVSGLYKRIILHYATFLTYSWVLSPHLKNANDSIKDKKNAAVYYKASNFCSDFQIEKRCGLFARDILVKGAYYGLIYNENDRVAIQDLPFEYCRSRYKNRDEVDIVEFNMKFFDTITDDELRKEILRTYPKVIQKGYYNYRHKNKDCWIFLPAEIGVYFKFFDEKPFFLDLIPLLDDLDDYKEIDKKRNLQALKRILVQKIPHDGMKLVFEPDEAEEMHAGAIEMLQDNRDVDILTTYADVNLLDLSSDDDEKTEVEDVQDLIYESAGVSKELFSATTDSGLDFSLKNDLSLMMILGNKFASFFTAIINYTYSTKKVKFKLTILPISHYNSDEYTTKQKDLAAFGYCFLTPVLSTGLDQNSLIDLKNLENDLLSLEKILKPLQSAYTQSGKTTKDSSASSQTSSITTITAKREVENNNGSNDSNTTSSESSEA